MARRHNDRDFVRELLELVEQHRQALQRPGEASPELIAIVPEITQEEACGFLRAVDEETGFFRLEDGCFYRPRTVRPSNDYRYPLLYRPLRGENRVQLWREWLTHAAIVAKLHYEYRYPRGSIGIDVVEAVDVLVWSPRNQPLLAVEAKKTKRELEKMVDEMLALQGRPFEFPPGRRLRNAEQKFRGLLALRPRFFVAVAPTVEVAYRVRYSSDGQMANLRRVPAIPTASST